MGRKTRRRAVSGCDVDKGESRGLLARALRDRIDEPEQDAIRNHTGGR